MRFSFRRQQPLSNSIASEPRTPITNLQQQYTLPGLLARSAYDNGFAPISAISDEIIKRNLRLGDINDPERDVTILYPFWDAIAKPNDRMGYIQFLDVMTSGFLSLSEFSLLVWHRNADGVSTPGKPDEGFNYDNIAGFTVLANQCKTFTSRGEEQWEVDFGSFGGYRKFLREDVITLKYSLLPDDGITGISPGSASSQEAAIRDRLNQQQRALFDNGATPSLIVTIHARSHDEASTIQQAYEKNNRGAARSGGVVYQTVIDNAMLAGMGEPKIVITPVGTANNDLAIAEIVEFTSTTITSNYGVSPIIYGDATTTTFQNQELANSKFMDRVQSILVRLCSNLENEIARITETVLPFTFVWDDVELDLTQEQEIKTKIKAEAARTFILLTQAGATSVQAATVLELDESWNALQINPPVAPALPELNVLGQGCTCDKHNDISDRISEREPTAQKKILNIFRRIAKQVFDGSQQNALDSVDPLDQELIDELTLVMKLGADKTGGQLAKTIGDDLTLADFGALSAGTVDRLERRANNIVVGYRDFVSSKLTSLEADDITRQTFARFYSGNIAWKANSIAQQETKNAFQNGELGIAENIDGWLKQNEPLSSITKTWRTTSAQPCPFCEIMDGVEAGIADSFVPGGLIESSEGTTVVLDGEYSDGTIPDAHQNCRCIFEFNLVSK